MNKFLGASVGAVMTLGVAGCATAPQQPEQRPAFGYDCATGPTRTQIHRLMEYVADNVNVNVLVLFTEADVPKLQERVARDIVSACRGGNPIGYMTSARINYLAQRIVDERSAPKGKTGE